MIRRYKLRLNGLGRINIFSLTLFHGLRRGFPIHQALYIAFKLFQLVKTVNVTESID